MNTMRTGLLLAAMTGLFLAVGYLIGGEGGMVLAFAVSIATNLFAYWNSDKMVLRMHNAQLADEASAPELYRMVRDLAGQADLPVPKIYLIHEDQPNAFATGRNPENAAVAATTGLLRMLSPQEVAGVMAHELAHIKNRDTLTMTVTATLAGAISMLANFALFFGGRSRDNPLGVVGTIAMMIFAPLAAMMVQMAISRTREYAADRLGAQICGNPLWLAKALGNIAQAARGIENRRAEANPATAHLFIINPLSGARMDNLFSTHPDTRNRMAALHDMAQEMAGKSAMEPDFGTGPGAAGDRPPAGPWSRTASDGRGSARKGPWG